jgi:electron transport complex protein RnfA
VNLLLLVISAVLVNNVVLARFLGICPYLGVSRQQETGVGMGLAVTFVMTLAAVVAWTIQRYVLEPLNLEFLQTIAFILVIASLVQLVETVLRKIAPALYEALGIYLPLITTNCAILGVAILNVQQQHDLVETLLFALGSAAGFTLAIVIFSGIREALERVQVPEAFRGTPIALIVAGLIALGFMGFAGLH